MLRSGRSKASLASLLVRGLVAGVAGTAAMTALQTVTQKLQGGEDSEQPPEKWSDAPAPAQVAEKAAETVGESLPIDKAPAIGNVMHWLYGTSWGAGYAISRLGVRGVGFAPAGIGFGAAVWAASYAELVPMGIYKPPSQYPMKDLALDACYHLAYGVAVAATFEALTRVA